MSIAYTVTSVLGAAMVGFSAYAIFSRAEFVVKPLADYGVPRSWWTGLGVLKAAGALGLLIGLFVPLIGIAAAIGIVLYFTGAVVTIIRARSYAHIPFPLIYLAPAAVALALAA
ncbi:DoxX family protein [Kitasatospora sp. NPDC006697]|uniref:DoxX family protein n=1 Tax=Kitasatospora sp. NPDC006697 TaxID=3364020 RepID=UPI00369EADE4